MEYKVLQVILKEKFISVGSNEKTMSELQSVINEQADEGWKTRAEWKNDRVYGTKLSMVLNHKCWYWYGKQNETLSRSYTESGTTRCWRAGAVMI